MNPHENSIIMKPDRLLINDPRKPLRVVVLLAVVLLVIHAIYRAVEYQDSGEVYHLIIGGVVSFLVGLLLSREFFFRTYKKEVLTSEIFRARIQSIPFGGDNVFLKLKLGRKTREIFIHRKKAKEVKAFLELLS